MPQQRMDIRMIKDILRLKYSAALSHEAIARSLGISKGVVAKWPSTSAWLAPPAWTGPRRPNSTRLGWSAGCSLKPVPPFCGSRRSPLTIREIRIVNLTLLSRLTFGASFVAHQ